MLVIRTRKRIKKQAVLAVTYLTTESVVWSPVEVFLEKTCCCQVRANLGMLPSLPVGVCCSLPCGMFL